MKLLAISRSSALGRLRRKVGLVYLTRIADYVDHLLVPGDPPEFDAAWREISPVLYWDRRPTARRLWQLARFYERGEIVEIGSFIGNSTIYLARAGGAVHAVDPHSETSMSQVPGAQDTSGQFTANLERFGVADRVTYHRMSSVEAARGWAGGPIRMLFVDGMHTREAVRADFEAWRPHLAKEHVVLFDDFLWQEVEEEVKSLVRDYPPRHFYVRGGQAIFSSRPLPVRVAGLP